LISSKCTVLQQKSSHKKIFGEKYKPRSWSSCCFLHSPVTSSFLRPNTFLLTQWSNTPVYVSPPVLVTLQIWRDIFVWINVARNRNDWRAFVGTVKNAGLKRSNFFIRWATSSFSIPYIQAYIYAHSKIRTNSASVAADKRRTFYGPRPLDVFPLRSV
jgi:hypothetical protein